jgi:hypothetical protein
MIILYRREANPRQLQPLGAALGQQDAEAQLREVLLLRGNVSELPRNRQGVRSGKERLE